MKLWLDDERDPTKPYIQEEFGAEPDMIWVKTVAAAINRLKDDTVTFISFDHDLGTKETGLDLANWIEKKAYHGNLSPLKWNVHSQNVVGARNIIRAMQNADKYWDLLTRQIS